MPSPTSLQQLRLDEFSGQLTTLLNERGCGNRATNLQGGNSSWPIEHLDNLLGTLHPSSSAFRKCLRELWTLCGSQKLLPQSHILRDPVLNTTEFPIASRGTCDVYEGLLNDSKVCVKRLRIYSVEGPKNVKRAFCQEAVVWKRLVHPNIVPLLGITVSPFQFISVWMPGGELSEYIDTHPYADHLGLVSDVANGLDYLHSHGIIHGDLKGPSILVGDAGRARLTDFGLAAVALDFGSAGSITDDHAVRWAAPEILNMERSVSKESDVYSFGMVVVEIFTGKVPFYDSTPTAVAVDVLSGIRPARPAHPNLTNDLWGLTEHCWNQDPQRRPEISEVILCLQTISIPRHGNITTPDGMVLGSVQKRELPSGSRHQSSRPTPSPRKPQGLWKRTKPSPVSYPAPHEDSIHDVEYEKSTDTRHESPSASNSPRRKSRWHLRYINHPKRHRYDRLDGSSEKQEVENYYASFKRSLMQCIAVARSELRPLKSFSVRCFPSSFFKK